MSTRAAIYVRQSLDRTGEALGVTRQQEDCRTLCDRRGWQVAHVIVENSVSASKGVRPGFLRLLDLIKSGEIDAVAVFHMDRLLRKMTDLEDVIELVEATGVQIATVTGDLDLSNDTGRLVGRILASVSRGEVERKSARQKRANQQKAQAGKPHVSHRAFGYEQDGLIIRQSEALVLREIAGRVVAGESVRDVAWLMNERGITTAQGRQWFPITVRNMLMRKRYIGVREHNGVDYPAIWPAIFTVDEWESLQAVMRLSRERYQGRDARKYLLTSLAICGKCGGRLNGETKRDPSSKNQPVKQLRPTYHCRACHGVTRNAVALDAHVRDAVIARIDAPTLTDMLARSKGDGLALKRLVDERETLQAKINRLVDDYADDTLSREQFIRARGRAESALEAVNRELETLHRSRMNVAVRPGETLQEAWANGSPAWRRQLCALMIERITVNPTQKKPLVMVDGVQMRFDANSIEIEWR